MKKGIILAAGNGTRLSPLNQITSKSLLPLYDKPIIYHSILNLVKSGIKDILLIIGGQFAGEFVRIIGDGKNLGVENIYYTVQKEAKGIAHALSLAEKWSNNEPIVVYLADNVFEYSFEQAVKEYDKGARIFVKKVNNPEHFGVVEIKNNNVISIEEKPKAPKSNLVATGLYFYDSSIWEIIKELKPSARGEYEITDVNKEYLKRNQLKYHEVIGDWFDSGSNINEYLQANLRTSQFEK